MCNKKTQKNTIVPKKDKSELGLVPPTSEFFSDFWNFFEFQDKNPLFMCELWVITVLLSVLTFSTTCFLLFMCELGVISVLLSGFTFSMLPEIGSHPKFSTSLDTFILTRFTCSHVQLDYNLNILCLCENMMQPYGYLHNVNRIAHADH